MKLTDRPTTIADKTKHDHLRSTLERMEQRCAALKEGLRKWECDNCDGGKIWRLVGNSLDETEQIICPVCEGTNIHPIARAILAETQSTKIT